jgi:hypothetical protein
LAESKRKAKIDENMTLPPAFPQSFYAMLNLAAKDAGMSRSAFAMKAVRFYSEFLKKRKSPATKVLGPEQAQTYAELSGKVMRDYWSKLTPEEKTMRAKIAAEGRWGKKKK